MKENKNNETQNKKVKNWIVVELVFFFFFLGSCGTFLKE